MTLKKTGFTQNYSVFVLDVVTTFPAHPNYFDADSVLFIPSTASRLSDLSTTLQRGEYELVPQREEEGMPFDHARSIYLDYAVISATTPPLRNHDLTISRIVRVD